MSVSRSASAVFAFTLVAAPVGATQAQEVHAGWFVAQPVPMRVVTDASMSAAIVQVMMSLLFLVMTRTRGSDLYAKSTRQRSGGHLVVGIEHNG
jgi:hypothetical protein